MRKIKAAADAQEQLGEAAQNLIQTFTQLDQSGQAYDQAIMDMLSNKNFEDSTQSEVEALKDEIEKAGGTEAYLDQRFGDGEDGIISDKTAQKYLDTLVELGFLTSEKIGRERIYKNESVNRGYF